MDPKLQDYLIQRVEKIDEKVDRLLAFKWQMIGATTVVSLVITLGIQFVHIIWQTK